MNRISIIVATLMLSGMSMGTVRADVVLLFDLETQRDEWIDALGRANKIFKDAFDLGGLADFGIEVIDGPLTFEGSASGSVPFGFLPDNVALDSNLAPFGEGGANGRGVGGGGLLGVGPSAGFGNPSNAIVSNFADDSFDLLVTRPYKSAMSFHALSLSGSDTLDLTVYDVRGRVLERFTGLDAPSHGHEYGIIFFSDLRFIGRVNLYDASGGREGILGRAEFYEGEVPSPAAWAIVTLSFFACPARRRKRA
jgi:hypothetical protein